MYNYVNVDGKWLSTDVLMDTAATLSTCSVPTIIYLVQFSNHLKQQSRFMASLVVLGVIGEGRMWTWQTI